MNIARKLCIHARTSCKMVMYTYMMNMNTCKIIIYTFMLEHVNMQDDCVCMKDKYEYKKIMYICKIIMSSCKITIYAYLLCWCLMLLYTYNSQRNWEIVVDWTIHVCLNMYTCKMIVYTCIIEYVKMQDNCVHMEDNFVYMQENNVYTQNDYVCMISKYSYTQNIFSYSWKKTCSAIVSNRNLKVKHRVLQIRQIVVRKSNMRNTIVRN